MKLLTAAVSLLCGAFLGQANAGELPSGSRGTTSQPVSCDRYGDGFQSLAGTDTCLKIGGRIRADYLAAPFKMKSTSIWAAPGKKQDFAGPGLPRAEGRLLTSGDVDFDARTPTDFGTVRTYVRVHELRDPSGPVSPFQ